MKITDSTLEKIEKIFGYPLYDWQKEYLRGITNERPYGRCNGKTFAYCIRLLLEDREKIPLRDIKKYKDEMHGSQYTRWFCGYLIDINKILIGNGFETNLVQK
jgi:hypothetical protein